MWTKSWSGKPREEDFQDLVVDGKMVIELDLDVIRCENVDWIQLALVKKRPE
jgi:hypothetical protein